MTTVVDDEAQSRSACTTGDDADDVLVTTERLHQGNLRQEVSSVLNRTRVICGQSTLCVALGSSHSKRNRL